MKNKIYIVLSFIKKLYYKSIYYDPILDEVDVSKLDDNKPVKYCGSPVIVNRRVKRDFIYHNVKNDTNT